MRPTDDLAGRLRALDTVAFHASRLPDVSADRAARLQEIWLRARSHGPEHRLPRAETPAQVALDAEVRARHEYVEEDRRAYPMVGDHQQSTEADGSGPVPDLAWRHAW